MSSSGFQTSQPSQYAHTPDYSSPQQVQSSGIGVRDSPSQQIQQSDSQSQQIQQSDSQSDPYLALCPGACAPHDTNCHQYAMSAIEILESHQLLGPQSQITQSIVNLGAQIQQDIQGPLQEKQQAQQQIQLADQKIQQMMVNIPHTQEIDTLTNTVGQAITDLVTRKHGTDGVKGNEQQLLMIAKQIIIEIIKRNVNISHIHPDVLKLILQESCKTLSKKFGFGGKKKSNKKAKKSKKQNKREKNRKKNKRNTSKKQNKKRN